MEMGNEREVTSNGGIKLGLGDFISKVCLWAGQQCAISRRCMRVTSRSSRDLAALSLCRPCTGDPCPRAPDFDRAGHGVLLLHKVFDGAFCCWDGLEPVDVLIILTYFI